MRAASAQREDLGFAGAECTQVTESITGETWSCRLMTQTGTSDYSNWVLVREGGGNRIGAIPMDARWQTVTGPPQPLPAGQQGPYSSPERIAVDYVENVLSEEAYAPHVQVFPSDVDPSWTLVTGFNNTGDAWAVWLHNDKAVLGSLKRDVGYGVRGVKTYPREAPCDIRLGYFNDGC